MGGDEFAIIVENTSVENTSAENTAEHFMIDGIAEKVCELVSMPIPELPADMSISASIGAAIYPYHTRDKKRLLKYADVAMYEAKKNKNTWRLYEPSLEHD
jgi:diguanylate cyclase (GGDEF)-like protein